MSVIWDVLSDLDSYADWNPFLPLASGNIVEGERIEVFIKPPRAKGTTITPASSLSKKAEASAGGAISFSPASST